MLNFQAELDALGDDLALDEDSSYLDQVGAPSAPTSIPGEDSAATNKVRLFSGPGIEEKKSAFLSERCLKCLNVSHLFC